MKVSIIVPSRKCMYFSYLMWSLRNQSIKPYEIILVVKECNLKSIENICNMLSLPCVIIEQREGHVTHALNTGKKNAKGDIVIFTDDDAAPLKKWVERYVKLHITYSNIAGISSRDIYLEPYELKITQTPDDKVPVRLYRGLVRPWFEPPHPLLKRYRLGVYITRNLNIAHGLCIPYKTCYSLPFRGVNMSFKTSYVYDTWFPEHALLKRAIGFEQYFGLQLVLKSLDTIYVPNNPVLHIVRRESLSRTKDRTIIIEYRLMKALIKELLNKFDF